MCHFEGFGFQAQILIMERSGGEGEVRGIVLMRHLGRFKRIYKGKCVTLNIGPYTKFLTGRRRRKRSLGGNWQLIIVLECLEVFRQIR